MAGGAPDASVAQRARTLKDLLDVCRYLFVDEVAVDPSPKAVRKAFRKEGVWDILDNSIDALIGVGEESWNAEIIMKTLKETAKKVADEKFGAVAQPIRILVTGTPASLPIDLTLELLGRQRTLDRLRNPDNRATLQNQ